MPDGMIWFAIFLYPKENSEHDFKIRKDDFQVGVPQRRPADIIPGDLASLERKFNPYPIP